MHEHAIAGAEVRDSSADRGDLSRGLVAEHERRLSLHVPAHDVTGADAASAGPNQNLTRPDARHVHLGDPDVEIFLETGHPHRTWNHGGKDSREDAMGATITRLAARART